MGRRLSTLLREHWAGVIASVQREGDTQSFGDYNMVYSTHDYGERKPHHVIRAYHPSSPEHVGEMVWSGAHPKHPIANIEVHPDHGRRGLATAMWRWGQTMTPRPTHSSDRTDAGNAWSKSTGDPVPRRYYP